MTAGRHSEGSAKFQVARAFYRAESKVGRDLAVLAAAVYRRQWGRLRVLDAMTGCGVRALRYQQEAGADWVWANEANPEVQPILVENLARGMRPGTYGITQMDANQVFFQCCRQQDFYDLVDIDSFGSPMPFLSTGLWAVKLGGLLYLTSTDGRTSGGHAPEKSVQVYGACARNHPAVHEQGLRLLLGAAAQQAAARGLHIQPVFAWFDGRIHRAMVRVCAQAAWVAADYGFLGYCHRCGQFQTVSWRQLGRLGCVCAADADPKHQSTSMPVVSGPMWLGPLHGLNDLQAMAAVAADWGWQAQEQLLAIMMAEADMPPYYYPLAEIGRRGRIDIPSRQRLIQGICALRDHAVPYRATRTHLDAQAIKTDAPLAVCLEVARSLNAQALRSHQTPPSATASTRQPPAATGDRRGDDPPADKPAAIPSPSPPAAGSDWVSRKASRAHKRQANR